MNDTHQGVGLGRIALGLALDYFRWTQLVPMIVCWSFLLLMVGAILLASFQQQSFDLIERGLVLYERVAGPIEPLPDDIEPADGTSGDARPAADGEGDDLFDPDSPGTADTTADTADTAAEAGERSAPGATEPPDGAIRFTDEDVTPVVVRAWAILALAGWLLGMLRTMLFGPREPVSLRRKLLWVALGGAVCSALMMFAWQFGSEPFHGGPLGWILLFVGAPLVVWIVSAWSLTIGHVIGHVQRVVYGEVSGVDAPTRDA